LRASTGDGGGGDESDAIILTNIDVAPEPPEAHDPSEDDRQPSALEPELEPEPAATIEAIPEPEPEPEELAELVADAGVELDAEVAAAETEPDAGADDLEEALATADGDAGVDGGELVAETALDAGVAEGDGGQQVAAADLAADAGVEIARGSRGPVPDWVDGPAPAEPATGDPGTGEPATVATVAPGGTGLGTGEASSAPPGAGANLLAYLPQGEVVTLLLRLDRFRGTQWAQRMEAVVRPMPDYQAIVGGRNVLFSDLFDTLIISSPRPQDVAATTLVGRFRRSDARVRRFLNHRDARVRWRSGRGGSVGHRQRSKLVLRHDRRVFLIPYRGVVMLAPPKYFGALLRTTRAPLGSTRAADSESPDWIKRVRNIELESGLDAGPALLMTMVGFPRRFEIPLVGTIPAPERATLAAEITEGGFLVRGNLLFSSEARAVEFMKFADEKQKWLVGTVRGRLVMAPFHAFNAVKGLSLKRRGKKVSYATSISVADGRAMLDYGAQWTSIFFPNLAAPPPGGDKGAKPAGGG